MGKLTISTQPWHSFFYVYQAGYESCLSDEGIRMPRDAMEIARHMIKHG